MELIRKAFAPARHHLESYRVLVQDDLPQMVQQLSPIVAEHRGSRIRVSFDHATVHWADGPTGHGDSHLNDLLKLTGTYRRLLSLHNVHHRFERRVTVPLVTPACLLCHCDDEELFNYHPDCSEHWICGDCRRPDGSSTTECLGCVVAAAASRDDTKNDDREDYWVTLQNVTSNVMDLFYLPVLTRSCLDTLRYYDPLSDVVPGYFVVRGSERVVMSQYRSADRVVIVKKLKAHRMPHIMSAVFYQVTGACLEVLWSESDSLAPLHVTTSRFHEPVPFLWILELLCPDVSRRTWKRRLRNLLSTHAVNHVQRMLTLIFDFEFKEEYVVAVAVAQRSRRYHDHSTASQPWTSQRLTQWSRDWVQQQDVQALTQQLLQLAAELLTVSSGVREPSARQELEYKRVFPTGRLLKPFLQNQLRHAGLRRRAHKCLMSLLRDDKPKRVTRLPANMWNAQIVTDALETALVTGYFADSMDRVSASVSGNRVNVTQPLDRQNRLHTLSQLQRLVDPNADPLTSNLEVRLNRGSHLGYRALYSTPESEKLGLIQDLACTARITLDLPLLDDAVLTYLRTEWIRPQDLTPFVEQSGDVLEMRQLWFNGVVQGILTDDAPPTEQLLVTLQTHLQKQGPLWLRQVSVQVINGYAPVISVRSDGGRFIRPVLVTRHLPWSLDQQSSDLDGHAVAGRIKWLAAEEQCDVERVRVAFTVDEAREMKVPYCELHPTFFLGPMAHTIPFAQHNPFARLLFQCGQTKQSMGLGRWLRRPFPRQGSQLQQKKNGKDTLHRDVSFPIVSPDVSEQEWTQRVVVNKMIIPMRCFTCGMPIAQLYPRYLELVQQPSVTTDNALSQLGLVRFCCRTMMMTHVDLSDHFIAASSSQPSTELEQQHVVIQNVSTSSSSTTQTTK